jgi:hypothetical protein
MGTLVASRKEEQVDLGGQKYGQDFKVLVKDI